MPYGPTSQRIKKKYHMPYGPTCKEQIYALSAYSQRILNICLVGLLTNNKYIHMPYGPTWKQ